MATKNDCDNFQRPWGWRDWDRVAVGLVGGWVLGRWYQQRQEEQRLAELRRALTGSGAPAASGAVLPLGVSKMLAPAPVQAPRPQAPIAAQRAFAPAPAPVQAPSFPAPSAPEAPVSRTSLPVTGMLWKKDNALWQGLSRFAVDPRIFEPNTTPRLTREGVVEFGNRTGSRTLSDAARSVLEIRWSQVGDANDPGALIEGNGSPLWVRTDDDQAVSLLRSWIDNRIALATALR